MLTLKASLDALIKPINVTSKAPPKLHVALLVL